VKLTLPDGIDLAVAMTVDFDAHSNWLGSGMSSPTFMSRGEFGAEVGVTRVLETFRAHSVKATFFMPSHTVVTYPNRVREIMAEGHETATHGRYHEVLAELGVERERELLTRQIEEHVSVTGTTPKGYRAPAWDPSDATLGLLEEFGFVYDSSLMGRDFEPYHPRPLLINRDGPSTFGPPSPLIEFPVSWYLDDFSYFEFAPGLGLMGASAPAHVLDMWITNFDYAIEREKGGVLTITVHPQTIGRAHNLQVLDRFLAHVDARAGSMYAALGDLSALAADRDDVAVAART
jgi:peptidoglycan/xylan/chitin deacetylase (PgdA/CDA1 family)